MDPQRIKERNKIVTAKMNSIRIGNYFDAMIYGACIAQGIPIGFEKNRRMKRNVGYTHPNYHVKEVGNDEIQNEIDYWSTQFDHEGRKQNIIFQRKLINAILTKELNERNFPMKIEESMKFVRYDYIPFDLSSRIKTFNGYFFEELEIIASEFIQYLNSKFEEYDSRETLYLMNIDDFEHSHIFKLN